MKLMRTKHEPDWVRLAVLAVQAYCERSVDGFIVPTDAITAEIATETVVLRSGGKILAVYQVYELDRIVATTH